MSERANPSKAAKSLREWGRALAFAIAVFAGLYVAGEVGVLDWVGGIIEAVRQANCDFLDGMGNPIC